MFIASIAAPNIRKMLMKPLLKADGKYVTGKQMANYHNVPIFVLKEDDTIIYYSPVFDVSGYGYTDSEAEQSIVIAINEFLRYTLNKKTFEVEMLKLGWKRKKQKTFTPPPMSEMVRKRPYLSEILDDHDFQKKSLDVEIPMA